ncbi:MAG: bifunctional DNA primase/polymerase [Acidimicrobiales bacterium]
MGDLARLLSTLGEQSLRDAALVCASNGVPVFPSVPGAKRPLTRRGFTEATTDQRRIARWWDRWPQANIGLPTGNGGVDVVDVDRHSLGSGFTALERARKAGLVDGWACVVRTPSGGLHLYYPADAGRSQASWSVGEAHIDFRGTGGYVLIPPSRIVTSDNGSVGYELVVTGHHPSPLDAVALRECIQPHRPSRRAISSAPVRGGERIATWLAGRPEGNRNRALFWAACRYAEGAIPEDHAHDLLGAAAEQAGLSPREVAATIRSAYRRTQPFLNTSSSVSSRSGPVL